MESAFANVNSELVLQVIEAAAVAASAIAGMIVASDKRMDLVGAFALACVNAFGGGTVRDLLLDNRPFYWMEHWWFFVAILAICIPFVYSVRAFQMTTAVHRRSVKMDAVGLALFTITGAGIALARDAPLIVAVLMGVVAGTTGGVLRDVVTGEHWTRSTEQLKKVYLVGVANIVQLETAYHGGNPPSDVQSFVPRLAKGLKGQTLDTVRETLDRWYAAHPDQLKRPVLEMIWFEIAVPGLARNP